MHIGIGLALLYVCYRLVVPKTLRMEIFILLVCVMLALTMGNVK